MFYVCSLAFIVKLFVAQRLSGSTVHPIYHVHVSVLGYHKESGHIS